MCWRKGGGEGKENWARLKIEMVGRKKRKDRQREKEKKRKRDKEVKKISTAT